MRSIVFVTAAITAISITACGGGGESLSSTPMPPPPSSEVAPPQPAAAATINATFACANGLKLAVVFDNTANTATVTTDKLNVVLPARTTGSGYWYSDGRHGLRGKGKEVQWEVGRALPVKCTEV
jgi:membrane-bound inhibitor of C-type lysozyme